MTTSPDTRGLPASEEPPPLIYIVDDELTIGWFAEEILKRAGFRTMFFQEPGRALQHFEQTDVKPDLLLTDYHMTSLDGMELIECCKQLKPDLKTILYSGTASADAMDHYPFKPDRFLKKPFEPEALVDAVRSALAS